MDRQTDAKLYLQRAHSALLQARDNLNLAYYSDYDLTFTAGRTLAEEVLRDAQRFVEHAEQYLHRVGAL